MDKFFSEIEFSLAQYRMVIGVLILIMLIVVSILTYQNFDKQNQIIETGGFTDGKIKCVCNQEAWDKFQIKDFSNVIIENG
jgi:L-asparagine transporter-like permease